MPIVSDYTNRYSGRRINFLLLILAVITVLSTEFPTIHAQVDENIRVIEGTVINGTSGGNLVNGLTVLLHIQTLEDTSITESSVDEYGQFKFEDVIFDPNAIFGVTVKYQGVVYGRDIDLSSGSPAPFDVAIYESSSDDGLISIPRASVIYSQVEQASQMLWAFEIISIRNSSDRTYVPGAGPMQLLRFGLPPDAIDLSLDTNLFDAEVIQVDRGFALSVVVPPRVDAYEVGFSYRFPYSGDRISITRSYLYGAESLRVLAVSDSVTLSSDQLNGPDSVNIGDVSYKLLYASDVPKGFRLSVELLDLPQLSFVEHVLQRVRQVRPEYLAPAGLGLLLLSLIGFVLRRRGIGRHRRHMIEANTERDALVREIARLQYRLDQGKLSKEQYHTERAVLLGRLSMISLPYEGKIDRL